VIAEERFGPEVLDDLRERGHRVVVGAPWSEGSLSAVSAEEAGDDGYWFKAAANPRTLQGYAAGR
jgi:gamma-glutamyltranspeptidase/glutathione hydrolase